MSDQTQRICSSCGAEIGESLAECPHCERTEATPDALGNPGLQIPGYRILGALGEGGMGKVFLAEEEELGRRVAVKLISERLATNEELRDRFVREARTMASIEHSNVVRVYSFGRVDEQAYLVMEDVEGESLASRIRSQGCLDIDEALQVTRQVVLALNAAWERKVVHRDIKPSNVLIGADGSIRVADFGLAKPLDLEGADDGSLTSSGYLLGTPHYVSPEQAQGSAVDFRSDVYSLGIMLYEMLTGERPFVGTTPFAVVVKHLHEKLPDLREKKPGIPTAMQELVEWMTAKEPSQRPVSYQQLLERIDVFGRGQGETKPAESGRRTSVRQLLPMVVSILFLISFSAATVYLYIKSRQAEPVETETKASERTRILVAPFYGPDPDSDKEGRVIANLIEEDLRTLAGQKDLEVIPFGDAQLPRTEDEARARGRDVGAAVVIWGSALAVGGQTQVAPRFTIALDEMEGAEGLSSLDRGRFYFDQPSANQIDLRRSAADSITDTVHVLLGTIALEVKNDPGLAIDHFRRAGQAVDPLLGEARALVHTREGFVPVPPPFLSPELRRLAEANPETTADVSARNAAINQDVRRVIEAALAMDPESAQAHVALADLLWETGSHADAVKHYRAGAEALSNARIRAPVVVSRNGFFWNRKLWIAEDGLRANLSSDGTLEIRSLRLPYLVGLEPESWTIFNRVQVPGSVRTIRLSADGGVEIDAGGLLSAPVETLASGEFRVPLVEPSYWERRQIVKSRLGLASCFEKTRDLQLDRNAATGVEGLDWEVARASVASARLHDPTNPWHTLILAVMARTEGDREGVTAELSLLEAPVGSSILHELEYNWMAGYALANDQAELARSLHDLARFRTPPMNLGGAFSNDPLMTVSYRIAANYPTEQGEDGWPEVPAQNLATRYEWFERWRASHMGIQNAELLSCAWQQSLRRAGLDEYADYEKMWREEHEVEVPFAGSLRKESMLEFLLALLLSLIVTLVYVGTIIYLGNKSEGVNTHTAKRKIGTAVLIGTISVLFFFAGATVTLLVLGVLPSVCAIAIAIRWLRVRQTNTEPEIGVRRNAWQVAAVLSGLIAVNAIGIEWWLHTQYSTLWDAGWEVGSRSAQERWRNAASGTEEPQSLILMMAGFSAHGGGNLKRAEEYYSRSSHPLAALNLQKLSGPLEPPNFSLPDYDEILSAQRAAGPRFAQWLFSLDSVISFSAVYGQVRGVVNGTADLQGAWMLVLYFLRNCYLGGFALLSLSLLRHAFVGAGPHRDGQVPEKGTGEIQVGVNRFRYLPTSRLILEGRVAKASIRVCLALLSFQIALLPFALSLTRDNWFFVLNRFGEMFLRFNMSGLRLRGYGPWVCDHAGLYLGISIVVVLMWILTLLPDGSVLRLRRWRASRIADRERLGPMSDNHNRRFVYLTIFGFLVSCVVSGLWYRSLHTELDAKKQSLEASQTEVLKLERIIEEVILFERRKALVESLIQAISDWQATSAAWWGPGMAQSSGAQRVFAESDKSLAHLRMGENSIRVRMDMSTAGSTAARKRLEVSLASEGWRLVQGGRERDNETPGVLIFVRGDR